MRQEKSNISIQNRKKKFTKKIKKSSKILKLKQTSLRKPIYVDSDSGYGSSSDTDSGYGTDSDFELDRLVCF